jgi:hypothetical protein
MFAQLILSALAVAANPVADPAPAPAATAEAAPAPASNKRYCAKLSGDRGFNSTGTVLTRKVCLTARQWKDRGVTIQP